MGFRLIEVLARGTAIDLLWEESDSWVPEDVPFSYSCCVDSMESSVVGLKQVNSKPWSEVVGLIKDRKDWLG